MENEAGCLACAVGSDDRVNVTLTNGQTHIAHRAEAFELLDEAV